MVEGTSCWISLSLAYNTPTPTNIPTGWSRKQQQLKHDGSFICGSVQLQPKRFGSFWGVQVEGRKRHEFLSSVASVMDAHLQYFKDGFEALSELEPLIHEVPTCEENI